VGLRRLGIVVYHPKEDQNPNQRGFFRKMGRLSMVSFVSEWPAFLETIRAFRCR
jgi:hypothetical protein